EVSLAEDQLAHDALAAGQIHVWLHPHTADGGPLPGSNLGPDALEERRVVVLDPFVLRGLRAREVIVGVHDHQSDRRGEGARALSPRLANRPEPGRVDVGVTDGDDAVGTGARLQIE